VNEKENDAPAPVDDLEKPVTDTTAEQVRGGAGDGSVTPAPILVRQINPRMIVPCV
jgi:hypothetical protein